MGRKGTPFPHLQFVVQSIPTPQLVTMLGKGTRPRIGGPNLNVPFPHLKFCTSTTGYGLVKLRSQTCRLCILDAVPPIRAIANNTATDRFKSSPTKWLNVYKLSWLAVWLGWASLTLLDFSLSSASDLKLPEIWRNFIHLRFAHFCVLLVCKNLLFYVSQCGYIELVYFCILNTVKYVYRNQLQPF